MKTQLDCLVCFTRQAIKTAQRVHPSETIQQKIVKSILQQLADFDLNNCPPKMGQMIHRTACEISGCSDPYAEEKQECNQLLLAKYGALNDQIRVSSYPLETAIKLAIAGNIIDFGGALGESTMDIDDSIQQALKADISTAMPDVNKLIGSAQTILYLADNAGEIVLDRLLIEQLLPKKITLVVRGQPIINDVTYADADAVGLSNLVEVIDSGLDAPGIILSECDPAFVERFWKADLVISKGQGNFETLHDVDKNILFLLKAKCPVVTRYLCCEVNSVVVRYDRKYLDV